MSYEEWRTYPSVIDNYPVDIVLPWLNPTNAWFSEYKKYCENEDPCRIRDLNTMQPTLKGIKVIGLDWTISLGIDTTIKHEAEEYQLTNINAIQANIDQYNFEFNMEYGDKIVKLLSDPKNCIEFFVNRNNLVAHVSSLPIIKQLYEGYHIVFHVDETMKKSHIWYLDTRIQGYKLANAKIVAG